LLILGRPLAHYFSRNLAPDSTHYLNERPEMNFQDESSWKAKPTRNKNQISQKKAKKTIKLGDLKPIKDAKGGRGRCSDYLNRRVQ
jgi:hypothetical protein